MEPIIRLENVFYEYPRAEQPPLPALRGVSLAVTPGEFVAVIGHNGSGKSTMAKLMNGLYLPTEGSVTVKGMDTADDENLWPIRQSAGMVFQNPDNQMVATIVEEDVAFGPENLGLAPQLIRQRVDEALRAVGMAEKAQSAPHMLSGGQKQRIAIAGIIAMRPEIIILDEPTAMLDPVGRAEVMDTVVKLNREQGITVVHITHFMEEAVHADRVVVMEGGRIIMQGRPREIFRQVARIKQLGLDVPKMTELSYLLRQRGVKVPDDTVTVGEMVEALCRS
ncbi:energy-coupling factor transporter ATPase [Christensenellaceae bacterium NSJ-44]|uniref:Energy-coupling factor transporter ATPase n=1 Tax=Luoshenia tenuis TaxID=2763654 RepID=A0A926D3V8_9FIRM|nr:energy-coupling factor transporter ATPase [Luoshenia tenuis]MBC8529875.1 energy-coupling factor transporter ATPase [Luoshenia tenuis]